MKYQPNFNYLIKSRYMLKICSAFMLTAFSVVPVLAEDYPNVGIMKLQQSEQKIAGTVVDANNEPVIGANVLVKGTTNGVITDMDGKFALTVSRGAVLQISYIGYITQEIKVTNNTTYTIRLVEDSETLEEVVVVGYGTMKKRDLTGAVTSVKMDDAPVGTISTISHALAGKAAGLQVNTVSAQPGGQSTFRIRGAASSDKAGNDPLIIIDGFPVSDPGSLDSGNQYSDGKKDNVLGSINPNDIESIEILKDASSTAIYGARAGNGVIIVTTKRGKSGAAKVQYSGSASVQEIAKSYDVLDASGFMKIHNHYNKELWMSANGIGIYGGKSEAEASSPFVPNYTDEQIANPEHNTNWFDEITRLGFQTSHNISITGGNDNTKYLVSGNYFKQDGVIKNNAMERYSARVNLDQKLSKYVKMGVNLNVTRNSYDNVSLGDNQAGSAGVLVTAVQYKPTLPVRDENGDYTLNQDVAYLPNPVSLLDITDKTTKERLLGTVFLEVRPIQDLLLKANFGIDRNYQKRRQYLPTTTLYGAKENGAGYIGQSDKSDYLMELTANYTKSFGDHNLNVLAGHSYQLFDSEFLSAKSNDFITDGFLYNNLGAGNAKRPTVGSSATKSRMASFFGRVNYKFMDRYILTASLRADGSSLLASGHKWGYFPSVALAWRMNEEAFLKNIDNLSNLKLRLSWGESGQSAIDPYQTIGLLGSSTYSFNNELASGLYPKTMSNKNLTWETTSVFDLGVDFGLFNNRLSGSLDIYKSYTRNVLMNRKIPSTNGYSDVMENIGKTENFGIDITLNSVNIQKKNFTWTTDFTLSHNKEKIKELASGALRDEANSWFVGEAFQVFYDYKKIGIWQLDEAEEAAKNGQIPGDIKIQDTNDDGEITPEDRVIYSKRPKVTFGINNAFTIHDFEFSFFIYSRLGQWIDYEFNRGYKPDGLENSSNVDYWTPENPTNDFPRPNRFYGFGKTRYSSTLKYEKGSFVKIRDITLAYNLPAKALKNIGLDRVRIYATAKNFFTFSSIENYDPERGGGISFPMTKQLVFGVNLDF